MNPVGPLLNSSSLFFRVNFSICCSSPHQGRVPPPLSRMETFTHLRQSCKMSQWIPVSLDYVFFSIVSSLINGFYRLFLSNLHFMRVAPLQWMLRKRRNEMGCLFSHCGSLSLSLSFLHPPSLEHAPSLLLTAPPNLFLFSLLLSLSLSLYTYKHTQTDMHFSCSGS